MNDLSVNEMLAMQQSLQARYGDRWEPIGPEAGKHKLLWMVGEVGEVIDVVKKHGEERCMTDPAVRSGLVEELADVMMYYHDVLLCYGVSAEELRAAYTRKFERNMTRWETTQDEK